MFTSTAALARSNRICIHLPIIPHKRHRGQIKCSKTHMFRDHVCSHIVKRTAKFSLHYEDFEVKSVQRRVVKCLFCRKRGRRLLTTSILDEVPTRNLCARVRSERRRIRLYSGDKSW